MGPLPPSLRVPSPRFPACGCRLGLLEGREVALLVTGPGAGRAEDRVRSLLGRVRPDRALSFGFGAGLSRSLRSGDIVLAREVGSPDSPTVTHVSDHHLLEAARALRPETFRIETGRLITSPALVRSTGEKLDLAESSGAILADMETAGVARALGVAGVPTLYTRSVVDETEFDLPPGIERLLDSDGRRRPLEVLRLLASRPAVIPGLWRLGARSRRAAASLAWLVGKLVAGFPEPGRASSP